MGLRDEIADTAYKAHRDTQEHGDPFDDIADAVLALLKERSRPLAWCAGCDAWSSLADEMMHRIHAAHGCVPSSRRIIDLGGPCAL